MTKEKFNQLVESGDTFRLYFYAEWCSKCKEVTPNVNESKVKTFKIDGEKHSDICDAFDIKYYPAIVEIQGKSYTLTEGKDKVNKLLNG